eukprot:1590291-Karenia_brevis.AAC.1
MANGKLPRTTLMNFSCAARRARGTPGNDNGKWQAFSRYWSKFQLRQWQATCKPLTTERKPRPAIRLVAPRPFA